MSLYHRLRTGRPARPVPGRRHAARRGAQPGRGPGERLRRERLLRPLQGAAHRGQVDAGHVERAARAQPAVELAQGYRLACLAGPLSDCRVHVPPESLTALQRTQVEGLDVPVEVKPPVRSYVVRMDPAHAWRTLRGDDQRLCEAVRRGERHRRDCRTWRWCATPPPSCASLDWQARVTLRGREVIHVGRGRRALAGPGGGHRHDQDRRVPGGPGHGQTLVARGAMNPQIAYGEDVIARLMYAEQGAGRGRDACQAARRGRSTSLRPTAARRSAPEPSDIVEAVVVGNTAIHHLFLRLPVRQLAAAPYVPAVRARSTSRRATSGCSSRRARTCTCCRTSPATWARITWPCCSPPAWPTRPDTTLAIDIGTNTEMCLTHGGEMTSLSCASGPAFEGAHIKSGMRAAPGAIERVRIDAGRPGGVQDHRRRAAGRAVRLGHAGRGGATALGGPAGRPWPAGGSRAREADGELEFVIADEAESGNGRAITVTQHDIRELQLAKGAIRCGIETLLQDAGITAARPGPGDHRRRVRHLHRRRERHYHRHAARAAARPRLAGGQRRRDRRAAGADSHGRTASRRRRSQGGCAISNWRARRASCGISLRRCICEIHTLG